MINRGQSAPTFFYLTLLLLPTPLVIILPIATAGISQIQRIKRRFADPTDSCAECVRNADLFEQR